MDVAPGSPSSSPGQWMLAGKRLIFTANDQTHGIELWTLELDANQDDLNLDGRIDVLDMNLFCSAVQAGNATREQLDAFWSRNDTGPGDANMDHVFNSIDLMAVFQASKYKTGLAATWEDGDWNCDGLFNTKDLIFALQRGLYTP